MGGGGREADASYDGGIVPGVAIIRPAFCFAGVWCDGVGTLVLGDYIYI